MGNIIEAANRTPDGDLSNYLTYAQANNVYFTQTEANRRFLSRSDPLLSNLPNINVGQVIHSIGPSQLASLGIRQDGFYWYLTPRMTQTVNLFTRFNWVDGRSWVRVFSSPMGSLPTVNMIGMNIPWNGFLIQQSNGANQAYSYINTTSGTPLFNVRSDTTLTTGGNKPGFRVYIGQAGGHGFYNTTQGVCSWNNSAGAVGSGWISDGGSCGTFPSNIRWGMGQTSTAYTLSPAGTVWETWITW